MRTRRRQLGSLRRFLRNSQSIQVRLITSSILSIIQRLQALHSPPRGTTRRSLQRFPMLSTCPLTSSPGWGGLWQESVQSNLASAAAAKEYAVKTDMEGAWDQQLHAMDYLVYAYLQGAQDLEVRRVLDELKAIQKTEPVGLMAAYAFAAIPARYAIERRRWSEAVSITAHPSTFPWDRFPFAEAIIHFSRAIGAARSGDADSARRDVEKLKSLHNGLVAAKESYWADQVEILRRAAAAPGLRTLKKRTRRL